MIKQRGFEVVAPEHRHFPEAEIKLPQRADPKSAGYDFYLPNHLMIPAKQSAFCALDVKAYMLPDEVLTCHVRSSIGIKRKLSLSNTTGIIDASYYENPDNDGNIGVYLYNYGEETVVLGQGERVIQGIFSKYLISDEDETIHEVRLGGSGSSNRESVLQS